MVDPIDLNDGHIVALDGEREVRVARDRNEAEAVALALRDINDREVARVPTRETAQTIDEDRIPTHPGMDVRQLLFGALVWYTPCQHLRELGTETCSSMIPVRQRDNRRLCRTNYEPCTCC